MSSEEDTRWVQGCRSLPRFIFFRRARVYENVWLCDSDFLLGREGLKKKDCMIFVIT